MKARPHNLSALKSWLEPRPAAVAMTETLERRCLFATGPAVTFDWPTINEGNAGVSYASVGVRLSAASKQTIAIDYRTADGTAVAGSDYTAMSGRLSFSPGQTFKTVRVAVNGDRTVEQHEFLQVFFKAGKNVRMADNQANVYITDDEARVMTTSSEFSEGNSGTKTINFTVSLLNPYDEAVTVAYSTADSSAIAGEDYVATSGLITFAPGETSYIVSVTTLGDTAAEPGELFMFNLTSITSNVVNESGAGYGLIIDDDGYVYPDDGWWGSDPWSYWPGYYYY